MRDGLRLFETVARDCSRGRSAVSMTGKTDFGQRVSGGDNV